MSITYTIYNSHGVFHGVVQESGSVKSNIPVNGFAVDGEQHPLSTCVDGNLSVPTDEQIEADNSAKNLEIFRIDRNELLSKSDWTDLPNCPLSDNKKAEWQSYRQTLRDMPSQEGFDPLNPTFPEEPE